MDPRLLTYYNRELHHLREMGGEFAEEFPKIAGRLGLDGFECIDPYVERLLEGFAFMAARVQLKLDSEFPNFTQHMLQMVYPHYLVPTPSMAVVRFHPDLEEGSLSEGFTLPRHTVLRSHIGKGEQTACEYRTAHDVTLWPIELVEAEYFSRDFVSIDIPRIPGVKAGFRLKLKSTAGFNFNELSLDELTFHLHGISEQPMHIYEQLLANTIAVVARPAAGGAGWQHIQDAACLNRVGFQANEAMLPYGNRSFHGYRLIEEYFTLPQRYLFVRLAELGPAVKRCESNELEIVILLNRHDRFLENQVTADDFQLFCTPAINLFPKRADRIHLTQRKREFHVIPDRTRPLDFEVFDVVSATGYGSGDVQEQAFAPFYASHDVSAESQAAAYFQIMRVPRKASTSQQRRGPRSSYIGNETFISLVDRNERPFHTDLRQLGMDTLCTNRDLPLMMPVGVTESDFSIQVNAPVKVVKCLAGPTKPLPSRAARSGVMTWRLINHLSLNYLSLLDKDDSGGAAALRSLLQLYGETSEPAIRKQIEGVHSVTAEPITRPLPTDGPLTFGRGLQISLLLDESCFEGTGAFLMGAVLDEFFAKYVSLNSFTETVVRSVDRGDIVRWPARIGRRHVL
ncbi:MAG: type VI secretion system baseplate subunit TssF [Planctomycetales bacterium]|nr:type VI secretion system baseplate subunit TssF [Planctomycetales bacterium]